MFLSDVTITNVQAKLNAKNLSRLEVEIKSIFQAGTIKLARFTIKDEKGDMDAVIRMVTKPGDFLNDIILDAVYDNDFYLVSDIVAGRELDGISEIYSEVYPEQNNVTPLKSPVAVPTEKLNALCEHFSGNR